MEFADSGADSAQTVPSYVYGAGWNLRMDKAISVRSGSRRVASLLTEGHTLNRARVHTESSRELRKVIGIPGEPERDRDDACLGAASGRHFVRFSDQGDEFLVAR
jgi:hypothetical protein